MAVNTGKNNTYVYGNTAPAYYPEERPERSAEIEKQREENRIKKQKARKRLEREKRRSRISFVAMIFATSLVAISCVFYVRLQSELNKNMRAVNELETQLINIQERNDATEKRIETSVNLEDIKKIAIEELKMVYPAENQIQYYHIDKADYMEQYKDIPTGNEGTIYGMIFNE